MQQDDFKRLLYRLAAPRMIMDFYVMTGNVIAMLDDLEEDAEDYTDPERYFDHPAWQWPDDD